MDLSVRHGQEIKLNGIDLIPAPISSKYLLDYEVLKLKAYHHLTESSDNTLLDSQKQEIKL